MSPPKTETMANPASVNQVAINYVNWLIGVSAHLKSVPSTPNNWDQIYREHYPRIARLCRMMLTDDDDARETAQEVFIKALEYYRSDHAPNNWAAWLTRVAVNACHDRAIGNCSMISRESSTS